tara:strand:- start:374 stop:850 length:477 start_codon:yes stop_codon:yes gene_type:complete
MEMKPEDGLYELIDTINEDQWWSIVEGDDYKRTQNIVFNMCMYKYKEMGFMDNLVLEYFLRGLMSYCCYKRKYYCNGKICCVDITVLDFEKWEEGNCNIWEDGNCHCGDEDGYKTKEWGDYLGSLDTSGTGLEFRKSFEITEWNDDICNNPNNYEFNK